MKIQLNKSTQSGQLWTKVATTLVPLIFAAWAKCYKTFYARNLRMFVKS
jgi:hypothetical protein